MTIFKNIVLLLSLLVSANSILAQSKNQLEVIASFVTERPGNIAVSEKGRVFITMSDASVSKFVVKEILSNGIIQDFPDTIWTAKPKQYSIKRN